MNRIYIEPPSPNGLDPLTYSLAKREWHAEQVSKLYEAIAKGQFMHVNAPGEVDRTRLGEILLALVKLQEMK